MTKADPACFRQGRERIKRCGLAKENYRNFDGSSCILGSIGYDTMLPGRRAELELLAELLGVDEQALTHDEDCSCSGFDVLFEAITHWNDAPERTAEEVIALLEQAEQKAEADR